MLSSGQRAKLQLEAGAARGLSIDSAPGETQRWNTHVDIHVRFAEDVGSTPTASTKIIGAQKVRYGVEEGICPTSKEDSGRWHLDRPVRFQACFGRKISSLPSHYGQLVAVL